MYVNLSQDHYERSCVLSTECVSHKKQRRQETYKHLVVAGYMYERSLLKQTRNVQITQEAITLPFNDQS